MNDDNDGNGAARLAYEFIVGDDDDFDPTEFIKNWPKDRREQRLALGMLVARNARELAAHRKRDRVVGGALIFVLPIALVNLGDTFDFALLGEIAIGGVGAVVSGVLLWALFGKV